MDIDRYIIFDKNLNSLDVELYNNINAYLPVPKFLKLPKVHTVWRNKDIGDQFSHMEADNTFGT